MVPLQKEIIREFRDFAEELADIARKVCKSYFRTSIEINIKSDKSPVSIADREIEKLMRKMIQKRYPAHGIIGEEFGTDKVNADFIWVLDPIDGTQCFVTGKPTFGSLISLLYKGQSVIGVIEMPALEERWIGAKNQKTLFQNSPAQVRSCSNINDAWLFASSPHMFTSKNFVSFESLRTSAYRVVYGAECQAYGLLASGWIDIVCEDTMKIYDYCALIPIVEGANGTITDWSGSPLDINSNGTILASTGGDIHKQCIELLEQK